ncbi:hypothetical protein AAG570_014024 [Ranatra chinensis]|uniref:PRC-barrel domain-containing protein n=1 Tax=Ranatra chinensis TaxID=642074 RepID=A0ABD0XTJ7_9HEMI
MPTLSGHTRAISASRVNGTDVYNTEGDSIGHVEDVVLDKTSDKIMFAVIGFGGFLGIGQKFHAVPWSMLNYDSDKGGYVISMTREVLAQAPVYDMDELLKDDGQVESRSREYYGRFVPPPSTSGLDML